MTNQLQVNTRGAWKTVMAFGQGGQAMESVRAAVLALHEVSPEPAWRITNTANPPKVLAHIGKNTYGLWVGRGAEQ
ncbi:hypothetical protein M4R23_08905 [Acidovorax sp. GBBC 3332]|nr:MULTISPECIES: hypothetical protein [unclassified Acidovorax]MDA8449801.1 hypothetical protein [Acidovorax sp. GBBC 3297]MDA8459246.1 hypothetical protein [Acidovorax sp. GBBC 3333]MDA8464283.1 hypothetical protein [Acidovorax sp. GBBC 3332]MDA8469507.1 hypothetical protein [Acidovorax sp. GBBC 3299]